MDQKESVRVHFGPAAARYAGPGVHQRGPDLDAMLPAALLAGHERVLDVGCGAGHTALAFAPHVEHVEALDLTPAMLEQVRRLADERGIANLATRLGDVEALPYPDASFERVTCRLCAHHFPHPARALAEIARVLVPGGLFLLVDIVAPETPSEDTFLNAFELLRDPSHVRDHSVSDWFGLLGGAGLRPELLGSWELRQSFDPWTERIGASAEAVTGLRALFDAAGDEVRQIFEIGPDRSFALCHALLRARLA